MTSRVEIWGLDGIPEVGSGDDIGELLIRADAGLRDGDVVVVTSKVVSKAEGRLVHGSREEHLAAETARVVARRGDTQIVETHHGFVMAAAGIDASNVPAGTVALLPRDPDASARAIHQTLRTELGIDVAVIVSDTMGRPWRDGVIDTAIGAAGLDVLWDLRGQRDTAGHLLEATVVAIADELASAADLVKGKLAATPVAVIRGFPFTRNDPDRGARPLIRPSGDDMFRLGTRESRHQLVADATPIPGDAIEAATGGTVDVDRVRRAVRAIGPVDVDLAVAADGSAVSADGDPLDAGIVLGRLLSALAAEDLCGSVDTAPGDATAAIRVYRA
ncbi:MAG TPA: coenzyme F420-0:L-glutamate ligase [Mycobacteriales bacterium]|jgi:coenzyme F420-0:L-glutamate ligase/coenzyme F420-1:gamma-L-glutamate ligase|nr:coenzyme F420-0:L-glutamate ligase [Mycobacteriales bacterium]